MTAEAPPLGGLRARRVFPARLGPKGTLVYKLVTTTDHKTIGIMYIVACFATFFAGGLMALLMRTELADCCRVTPVAHGAGRRAIFGGDYHPGDYVFTFEDGRPPHPDTIRQRFDRLAAGAGLSRITFHDLRHSYATGALKAGINPKVVSERIGHADVGYFLQTYAHVLTNDDREAAEQAATFLIGNAWKRYDEHDNSDG